MRRTIVSVVGLALMVAGCQAAPVPRVVPPEVDLPLARPPFVDVSVQWKERLGTRYAFREVRGDYRRARGALVEFLSAARDAGLVPAGPGFALFFDDPADVPASDLRARVCLPVDPGDVRVGPWEFDLLPTQTVVYAIVEADHGAVPLAYPALFRFMDERGWRDDGPVREIYLYTPGDTPGAEDGPETAPWTEVQVPWRSAR